jgi:hypothetical protein
MLVKAFHIKFSLMQSMYTTVLYLCCNYSMVKHVVAQTTKCCGTNHDHSPACHDRALNHSFTCLLQRMNKHSFNHNNMERHSQCRPEISLVVPQIVAGSNSLSRSQASGQASMQARVPLFAGNASLSGASASTIQVIHTPHGSSLSDSDSSSSDTDISSGSVQCTCQCTSHHPCSTTCTLTGTYSSWRISSGRIHVHCSKASWLSADMSNLFMLLWPS